MSQLIVNPLGIYGKPERMRIGKSLRLKRKTEVDACRHIRNSEDPAFIPAPEPSKAKPEYPSDWLPCMRCGEMKPPTDFSKHRKHAYRQYRQVYCKTCVKSQRMKKQIWRREPRKGQKENNPLTS